MAQVKMIFAGVNEANVYLQKVIQQVQEIVSVNEMLKRSVDMEIQSRYEIAKQLHSCLQLSEELQRVSKGLLMVAEDSLEKYRDTEDALRHEIQSILNMNAGR